MWAINLSSMASSSSPPLLSLLASTKTAPNSPPPSGWSPPLHALRLASAPPLDTRLSSPPRMSGTAPGPTTFCSTMWTARGTLMLPCPLTDLSAPWLSLMAALKLMSKLLVRLRSSAGMWKTRYIPTKSTPPPLSGMTSPGKWRTSGIATSALPGDGPAHRTPISRLTSPSSLGIRLRPTPCRRVVPTGKEIPFKLTIPLTTASTSMTASLEMLSSLI